MSTKNTTKIILDACLNHNGDIRNVNQMILKAKESGADYIKFQMISVFYSSWG